MNSSQGNRTLIFAWMFGRVFLASFLVMALLFGSGCHRNISFSQLLGMIALGEQEPTQPNQPSQPNQIGESLPAGDNIQIGQGGALPWDQDPKQPAEDMVKDWKQPPVTLFISGRQHGYIEPCGCTGLENQKGGLMRRHTVQKILKNRGWDLISIDAGNQVRRFGKQPIIKMGNTYRNFCRVFKYDVIGFGPDDLKFIPEDDMIQMLADAQVNPEENVFTSANVTILDPEFTSRYRIFDRGGVRVGVTTIIGEEHLPELKNKVAGLANPTAALAQAVREMKQKHQCEVIVLVAQTKPENCRKLAKQFPDVNLLVNAGDAGDPTMMPELIPTNNGRQTAMIQCGVKGMYVGLVGIYKDNGKPRIEYQRVPLDARFKDSPELTKAFSMYQDEIKSLWQSGGLIADLKPRLHPDADELAKAFEGQGLPANLTQAKYVGSEACMECHNDEFTVWEDSPHTKATEDIINPPNDRGGIPRHWDPECVSCHATGWEPQEYFPYQSGLQKVGDNEDLNGSGCENCHGPGSAHVAIQELSNKKNGNLTPQEDRLRKFINDQIWLSKAEAKTSHCQTCHDLDNSPDFFEDGAFDEYWEQIEHGDGVRAEQAQQK